MTVPTIVTKLNGAPGAGKTTALFEYVEAERERGRSLGDLYYLTFSRSATEESAERLHDVYPDATHDEIGDRAKTVHGAAWTAAYDANVIEEPGQVIQPDNFDGGEDDPYAAFCRRRGLSYNADGGDLLRRERRGEVDETDESGNQFFAAYNWLKHTRRDYEQIRRAPVSLPMRPRTASRICEEWDEFKRTWADLPLLEHTDYVDEVIDTGLVPDADVLFIDEFQDLCPQEYLLYKTWKGSGELDHIYIAGDKNQSIHGFRAARPVYFEETDVHGVENRTTSYRCPSAVVSVARGILEGCDETDPNGFQAAREGGTAVRRRFDGEDELAESVLEDASSHTPGDETGNTVFLLTRTNRQVMALMSALEQGGVPYEPLGGRWGSRWDDPLPLVLACLRAIKQGRDVDDLPTGVERAFYKRFKTRGEDTSAAIERLRGTPAETVIEEINLGARRNPYYDRRRLRNALAAGAEPAPERVKVGTIHSAKGLEAPCVYLFGAYTPSLKERYYNGETTAEEHRLYYVGASRASETLRVVDLPTLSTETFPPFEGGRLPQAGVEEVLA